MGSLKICPLRTPICIAKWRSPKRGRRGTLSLRAPPRSGVRRPGFLRSEALRKGSPKTIIIFRQSHLLLWESTKLKLLGKQGAKWGWWSGWRGSAPVRIRECSQESPMKPSGMADGLRAPGSVRIRDSYHPHFIAYPQAVLGPQICHRAHF